MTVPETHVRSLVAADVPACAEILYGLPDWFGLEEANRAYVANLNDLPGAVAVRDDRVCGFLALAQHTPESFEIHVLAVPAALHRDGIGRRLVDWADQWCLARGARWLHVKTRGPSTPDPGYERTRRFYLGCGFEVLFESLELWGAQDAALILVRRLEPAEGLGHA
jgi:GNAT superfamily N-acetyltransferase